MLLLLSKAFDSMMTKPKRWHMLQENEEVILKYGQTPISKPNATLPLGVIQAVTIYGEDDIKYQDKGLKVQFTFK